MGYKCAPQLLGLVNGEPPTKTNEKTGKQYKNRHRANGAAIAMEMFEERASRSETLDRSRSHLNTYEGFTRGEDCWNDMLNDVDEYKMPVKLKNGQTAYRKLGGRQLAELVPGWSIILNPPPEMTVGWTDDDYDRFDTDGMEVLSEICPIFKLKNRKGKAIHRDEGRKDVNGEYGRHTHYIGNCWDDEGRYCGSVIDGRLYDEINRRFPAMMRDKGWDLDDLDVTDWARMGDALDKDGNLLLDEDGNPVPIDPEYKAEREAKRKKKGRSVNKVIADDRHEARVALQEAQAVKADAEKQATTIIHDAASVARTIKDGANEAVQQAVKKRLAEERKATEAAQDCQTLKEYRKRLKSEVEDAKTEAATVKSEVEDAKAALEAARQEALAVQLQVKAARKERDEAKDERDAAKQEAQEHRRWAGRLQDARQVAQTALQDDVRAMDARVARQGAKDLLAALGASVRPLVAQAVKDAMTDGSLRADVTPGPVAGSVYAQLRCTLAKMDAKPGPTPVEGPTR